ncbi:ARL14 effector protein-like [Erythrolamprus reginae]|uniref:ARL14 effector protein-like n=1 Tax=Erythrolamprus reginae TaxID=121349 RepID=UPI00396CCA4C
MDPEGSDEFPLCSVGHSNTSDCHLLTYNRSKGLKLIEVLPPDQQKLLQEHSGYLFDAGSTICLNHKALFLKSKKGLRVLDDTLAGQLKAITNKIFVPGQKLCPSCRKEVSNRAADPSSCSTSADDDEYIDISGNLNKCLNSITVSPLQFRKVSKCDIRGYTKRKIRQVQNIAVAGGFDRMSLKPKLLVRNVTNVLIMMTW